MKNGLAGTFAFSFVVLDGWYYTDVRDENPAGETLKRLDWLRNAIETIEFGAPKVQNSPEPLRQKGPRGLIHLLWRVIASLARFEPSFSSPPKG
jgi:hypothetical protein